MMRGKKQQQAQMQTERNEKKKTEKKIFKCIRPTEVNLISEESVDEHEN